LHPSPYFGCDDTDPEDFMSDLPSDHFSDHFSDLPIPSNPLLHSQAGAAAPGAPGVTKRLRGGAWDPSAPATEDYDDTLDDEVIDEALFLDGLDAGVSVEVNEGVKKKWGRPDVSGIDRDSDDINFQWLDMDMTSGQPLASNPAGGDKKVLGSTIGPVPVIRTYGCTDKGNSVSVFIHGFTPYALFAAPASYDNSAGHLEQLRNLLDERLRNTCRDAKQYTTFCHMVKFIEDRKSIMGYNTSHTRFLQVYVSMPTMLPQLKRIMEEGITLPGCFETHSCQPFETNVPFVLRFMIDRQITGAGWLTLPKGTYSIRREEDKKTHCQLEMDISYKELVAHECVGEWSKIAPLRVLSFDIECQGRKGYFPEADKDPVIQIANCVSVYGDKVPVIKNVFTLKGCLPIVGTQVITSDAEEDMLLKWSAFMQASDCDIITGYNVQNFDIPYLLDRADALNKKSGVNMTSFKLWGRVKGSMAKMKESTFQSAAFGKRNNIDTTVEGRVIFDMLPYMQKNHKLSSYTLNSVCAEYLGQQKEDVHHSIISDLQNGSDEDRHRLAVYCVKDALLPQQLMDKLSVLVNYIEMARVTGVPVSFLISRGQQIKVFSMLLRKCKATNLCIPDMKKGRSTDGVAYEGATVLDPIKSYYTVPICTLDFASLYPSIMQAYNLCYSTLMSPQDTKELNEDEYNKNPNGNFVKKEKKVGILPTILGEILAARKQAKKDMKNAPNEFEKAVQNGRQLALKISANSVYGFTGATVGQLPCLAIASSVTNYGRQLLEGTKKFVEEHYTIANGHEHDAVVVYGDTDSVMVKFGGPTVKENFPLAIEAAAKCTALFPPPIELEFEKVYYPYLLMNKKRYAGLMWTNVDHYDYMDTKGLETVRRDNCQLVRDVIQTSLNKILIDRDVEGAIGYVKNQISDLLQNKMDISKLVITKSLNKGAEYALGLPGAKAEDYKMKQAHVELAARMKKRDAGSAPQMGDRVPYVIIMGAKGDQTFMKSEDPIYVLDNNIPIDCKWYLTNQLEKPLTRIFEPIIEDVERQLLKGDHTRKVFVATPTARKGSLMMFAVKKATCMGCKALMDEKLGNLCVNCVPKEGAIYLSKLKDLRRAESDYAKLWSAAQRIHSSMFQDVMCTGDGCACQFYRRKKCQQDVKMYQEQVDKFGY
jgi:DNA polymerase delta subunit 1